MNCPTCGNQAEPDGQQQCPCQAPQPHVCTEDRTCTCSLTASEPDESCAVHGLGPIPKRCGTCGRFLPKPKVALSFLAQQYGMTAEDVAKELGCSIDEIAVEANPNG